MLKEHGLAVFEDALTKLDGKLQVLNKRITIRAIGGLLCSTMELQNMDIQWI